MGWTIRGWNPGRTRRFFSFPKHLKRLCGPPSLLFSRYRSSFTGLKRKGRVAHSPPFNAKVINQWSYTSSPPPIRHHGVDRITLPFHLRNCNDIGLLWVCLVAALKIGLSRLIVNNTITIYKTATHVRGRLRIWVIFRVHLADNEKSKSHSQFERELGTYRLLTLRVLT